MIAMLYPILFFVSVLGSLVFSANPGVQPTLPTRTPLGYPIYITSPKSGQALQGIIAIQGNSAIKNYSSSEIEFAYTNNPTNTWFLINYSKEPVKNNLLADWDTTTITDGSYTVRLRVVTTDGQEYQISISELRVRNYTPIETDTLAPISGAVIATSTIPPSKTPILPTPTFLPTNPAQFSTSDISYSLGRGAIATLIFFASLGLYLGIRRLFQRRS
jgi:hypothetical protein